MNFVLQDVMPWTLAAGALGVAFGLLAGGGTRRRRGAGPALLLVLALGLGFGAAADALGLAHGRYGLWLEAGLMIFGGYALGFGLARVFMRLVSAPARKTPDWLGAARETLAQAEAFVAAAPGALAANEAAAAQLAPAPADGPANAAPPAAGPPPAAITVLDGESPREPRAQRVDDPGAPVELASEDGEAVARPLGPHQAAIDFSSTPARLAPHGVASATDSAEAGTRVAAFPPAPAAADDLSRSSAGRAIDAFYPGERPPGVAVAPESGADDLTRIAGIDAAAERRLHGLGVWTFAQIAAWTADQARWVEFYLAEPGRAGRESWREQAGRLAS
jgi:predicted flap endonuclease-1-like 5' DNA nuclease